ncbi:MAG TPA: nuclear transport factor 2 family protein [Gemmatimonadales bacterium]|jgi:hypothetical protein
MSRRIAVLGALLLATAQAPRAPRHEPASSTAALKDTLEALERQSWDAWKARNGAFYAGFLSDDHIEMGASGRATKAEVVAFVGSPACVVASWEMSDVTLTVFNPTTALLTYHAAQQTVCRAPVPSPAWVSSLYILRGGRWQNALYQQTPER